MNQEAYCIKPSVFAVGSSLSILSFVMVFVCQTNSWAELQSSTKFDNTITLEPPTITDSDRDKRVAKQSKINSLRIYLGR